MEGAWDWEESVQWGDAQIKDVALRACFSVINKNEKKRNLEFGRKEGEVCAWRVLASYWGGQAASDPGDSRK